LIHNEKVYFCKLEKIVKKDFEKTCSIIEFLWYAIKKNFIGYAIIENKIILEKIKQTLNVNESCLGHECEIIKQKIRAKVKKSNNNDDDDNDEIPEGQKNNL